MWRVTGTECVWEVAELKLDMERRSHAGWIKVCSAISSWEIPRERDLLSFCAQAVVCRSWKSRIEC